MKKYFDENGNEIFVFEKGEKRDKAMFPRPHPAPGPHGRFPWWSIYTPVVPCIYDGNITLLEQISKLYYYANKLNNAINQNHDDIITLGERVDGIDVELARIIELIGDLPKFVHVEFDTISSPITADRTFEDLITEYKAGSVLIAHATGDKAFYAATYGDDNAIVFLAQQSGGNVSIVMTADEITQSITRNITSGGGTVYGTLNILNAPSMPMNVANKAYVDTAIETAVADYLPLAGGTMGGQIAQPLAPTENAHLANKKYVDDSLGEIDLSDYLPLAGGTMSGQIAQPLAPTENRHLVNKKYVDDSIGDIDLSDYLPLAGGTMRGQIIQPANPTENRSVVNKRYVDLTVGEATRYAVGAETKIGEWIENDIVYDVFRKVIDFGELPNASQKGVPHYIGDVTRFISARAFATSATNNLEIPMVSADGTNNIYLSVGNARITIGTSSDRSNFTICYVELKFIRPQPVQNVDG